MMALPAAYLSIDNMWKSPSDLPEEFRRCNRRQMSHECRVSQNAVKRWSLELVRIWAANHRDSYSAFEALKQLLVVMLDPARDQYTELNAFLTSFADESLSVRFLRDALPQLIDDDFVQHNDLVDQLLLYLTVHKFLSGSNLLERFISSTPYFTGYYLRQHEKRFNELYAYIHTNKSIEYNQETQSTRVSLQPHYLVCMHFEPKKVIVSNAPPVKLKRRSLRYASSNRFECEVMAGGLVSGLKPSLGENDVWVSYLEAKLLDLDKMPPHVVPKMVRDGIRVKQTFRRSTSILRFPLCESEQGSVDIEHEASEDSDENSFITSCLYEKTENDFLSLQKLLSHFSQKNFIVNPLIIMKEDHRGYYEGISNGLLWPAFHNLPDYIIDEYRNDNGGKNLTADWHKYVKDFVWIHDYHLMLVGSILRSLDPALDCGFFLHIPFLITDQFVANYYLPAVTILRALLGFTRVGFQSNRDTLNYLRMLSHHVPDSVVLSRHVANNGNSLRFVIEYQVAGGHLTSVGTFPISIDTEHFVQVSGMPSMHQSADIRHEIMSGRQGKLFLSVERFDYTKGIRERLMAIEKYFEQNPDRVDMDVFYQAADVLVTTPLADGMNLVIKEAIICNPNLIFILSTGPGAENQLYDAGLGDCYLRLTDCRDTEEFADLLRRATQIPAEVAGSNGKKMYDYTRPHTITRWLDSFCDISWTHFVLRERPVACYEDMLALTRDLQSLRQRCTYEITRSIHVDEKFVISSVNATKSLREATFDHREVGQLMKQIEFDLHTLKLITESAAQPEWVRHLGVSSSILIDNASTNVDLSICAFEPLIADTDPLSLQSLTSGILISRFFFRFCSTTIFISSSLNVDEMRDRCVFPYNFATLIGRDGAIVRQAGDGRAGCRGWLDRDAMGIQRQMKWALNKMKLRDDYGCWNHRTKADIASKKRVALFDWNTPVRYEWMRLNDDDCDWSTLIGWIKDTLIGPVNGHVKHERLTERMWLAEMMRTINKKVIINTKIVQL